MSTKCVKMCRNGDNFFPPVNVVINPRDIRNMDAFLDRVTQATRMRNAARRVCTPRRGHNIEDLTKLVSGQMYVAVGQEGFKTLEYGGIHIRKPIVQRREMKIEPVRHSRILMSARCRKVALWESAGLKNIYVYRNGDDKQPSHKILLDRRTLLNMDKVLEHITERVKLESGAVFGLYTLHGKEVCSTPELISGEKYVAVGHGKRFKRTAYNDNQKVSPNNSPRRPKIKHKVFMKTIHHLSATSGEVKQKEKVYTEKGIGGNEMQAKTIEPSRTVPENTTVEKHEKNDNHGEDSRMKTYEEEHDKKSKPTEVNQDSLTVVSSDEHDKTQDEIYKASGKKSEKAKQVEDDQEIKVEKPIDQVAAEEVVEELVEQDDLEDRGEITEPSDQVNPSMTSNETVEDNTPK